MYKLLLALVPVVLILLLSEVLWRKKIIRGERARKFIHILAGVWIAFWPFYLPFDGIFILGSIAFTLLLFSRYLNMFQSIYAVKRLTYGEIFFAVAIMFCAYFGQEPWIFTISILLLSLADGSAAVVGRFWGISNRYYVFGSKNLQKSIAGTSAYIVLTYVSIIVGYLVGGREIIQQYPFAVIILLPLVATLLENISPYGIDNFLSPVFATLLLNSLL